MPLSKRLFDLIFAVMLSVLIVPVILVLSLVILILDGGPVFYVSERMKTPSQGFRLWKFRTMTPVAQDFGVSGGDKINRVTKTGKWLRRLRLDELPQIWNVLRGDISFVGPRPPLRVYVERFPDLYAEVLKSRPGITGLASLVYHRHEELLISQCKTEAQTNAVYERKCVPTKAKLDLMYQANQSLCFDAALILRTARRLVLRLK
ncbi:sugar transferase [Algirhabdus cladophorae]|uniref:sugar transferase n=1 Tax=Algirhabdus cladophorae TaxID=3377108 RepID=UPI003B847F3F